MKRLIIFMCVILTSPILFSQTTITREDIENIYAPGTRFIVTIDQDASVDVGSPGGNNIWDFSDLNTDSSYESVSLELDASPFADDFPLATFVLFSSQTVDESRTEFWNYLIIEDFGFRIIWFRHRGLGSITTTENAVTTTKTTYRAHGDILLVLPLSAESNPGGSTDSVFTSTEIDGNVVSTSRGRLRDDYYADAYGDMVLPDRTVEAWRFRNDNTIVTETSPNGTRVRSRDRSFVFVAKSGEMVTVTTKIDTNIVGGMINGTVTQALIEGATDVVNENNVPEKLVLSQNYPNPFNPTTEITYSLPKNSRVELTIYNQLGQEIIKLVDTFKPAGIYQVNWDGRDSNGNDVASGIYIYSMVAEDIIKTRKMILIR
ncbi:T9SS type A sorting domain-containing protein [candidate division KSB1 bacterium]|nr:T9SS type A sorting domain-containing protein [candidate division KSB1 bacterium]NIR73013.1 T9SS type A sorting domain-containing protein [candidate division KSB1 bacterium]NIS26917.1 T9SS type A sorting domain-containing protein [candidate division KSB1 bacterium]NIT73750.1 T9SS type A sorting domain-containing protein [candidate division KSB1 bacterium]NIU27655.1 T9SS type A sorting domain-containing protein [candidate division KSB1 bacterium]